MGRRLGVRLMGKKRLAFMLNTSWRCWEHWVEAPFVGAARNGRGLVKSGKTISEAGGAGGCECVCEEGD